VLIKRPNEKLCRGKSNIFGLSLFRVWIGLGRPGEPHEFKPSNLTMALLSDLA
jgi:hypothetical protein